MKQIFTSFCFLFCLWYISQTLAEDSKVFEIKDCGSKGAEVKDVTMTPAVAKRGDTLTFTSKLTVNRDINGGKMKVRVMVRFFFIYITTFTDGGDLCKLIKDGSCPIKANTETTLVYTLKVPPLTRYGDSHCKITYTDEKGKEFVCFTLEFPFQPPMGSSTGARAVV